MIVIHCSSNNRTYSASSDEKPMPSKLGRKLPAWYDFSPPIERFGENVPARVKIGVASNALVGREGLNDGPRHIREGQIEINFDTFFDIALLALETENSTLSESQIGRLLRIISDQYPKSSKVQPSGEQQ